MNYISDIHTHILYGMDDGAADLQMSLQLLEMEYDQGVREIFLTNHSWGMDNNYKKYHTRFEELKAIVSEKFTDLNLYKGCEILGEQDKMEAIVRKIRDDIYPTMNGSKYILMEFDPDETGGMREIEYCLKFSLDAGFIPIVAHVERYKNLYDEPYEKPYDKQLSNLQFIKELGCKVQINLYSVEQDKGSVGSGSRKELANLFLRNKLVDFVGTDTHNLYYKSPEAAVGTEAIRRICDKEYADRILFGNVKEVIK